MSLSKETTGKHSIQSTNAADSSKSRDELVGLRESFSSSCTTVSAVQQSSLPSSSTLPAAACQQDESSIRSKSPLRDQPQNLAQKSSDELSSFSTLVNATNNITPLTIHHHHHHQLQQPVTNKSHLHNSSIKSSGSIKSRNKQNGSIKNRKSAAAKSQAPQIDPSQQSQSQNSAMAATMPSNASEPNLLTGAVAADQACSSSGSRNMLRTYQPSPSPSPTPLSQQSSNFSLNNGINAASSSSTSGGVGGSVAALVTFTSPQVSIDETPNKLVYKKIETVIEKMQDDQTGVPIRTVKSFMSKIPSVFTGTDLIQWMLKKLDVEDTLEALHFAHLIASHGYMFPIDDHILTVKNDGTFFRFQTPYYWPSNITEPENNDYAVYLCKRTMQNKTRLELADYEAENLAKLQKLLSKKWEFIYMQAEAQIKVDKKRDKMERKILDSQERAFWDVHKPAPGCVNTTEIDMRKTMRNRRTDFPQIGFFRHHKFTVSPAPGSGPTIKFADMPNGLPSSQAAGAAAKSAGAQTGSSALSSFQPGGKKISELEELKQIDNLKKEREFLKRRLERRFVKASKVSESYTNYFEQYIEFDPFLTQPDPSNPWITDSTDFWDMEKSLKDIPQRRVRRWGFSIHELLKDPSGRELFRRFLEKEYSSENLRFYEVCSELRYSTNKDIATKVENIYNEFLAPYAHCPINIDSRVMAITKSKMGNPDRHTYDEAREHIFNLMTRDSYNRFLRSDIYRDSLNSARKKLSKKY